MKRNVVYLIRIHIYLLHFFFFLKFALDFRNCPFRSLDRITYTKVKQLFDICNLERFDSIFQASGYLNSLSLYGMAIRVVEYSKGGYKIRKIFA